MEKLSTLQKTAAVIGIVSVGLFLCLYLSSALFFELNGLAEDGLKPWSIIDYWRAYYNHPKVINDLLIASIAPPVLFLVLFSLTLIKTEKLFGDARFASNREIKRKGLYDATGIIIGKRSGNFLVAGGTEHVLVAAPTRSGKGVGIVIPNLLNWDGSCVVLDIKLENYQATSGFRKKHRQKVYLFAPGDTNGRTHRYNPLDVIDGTNKGQRINAIQKIAFFLCPDPLNGDPMWASEGRNLFIAVVLYLIDREKTLTLGECNRFIKSYTKDELVELIDHFRAELDDICIANFNNFLTMGEKQAAGVKSTLTTALNLFDNPIIDAATAATDFKFNDLRKKRTTIYVGVTPDNLGRLAPLLNLFFQQCCDVLTSSLPDKKTEPHKVLMLLDEFTSLGRMDIIKDGIAFFAGYHLRLMPIIQGPSQLEDKYGVAGRESMIQNFMYQIYFAPNNQKDAVAISESLGTKTVKAKSQSRSTFKRDVNTTTSETGRALMLPQEVRQMSREDTLILIEAMPPIKAKKVVYYSDAAFAGRYYNVFDPDKNVGPLPVDIPVQSITPPAFVKDTSQTFEPADPEAVTEPMTVNQLIGERGEHKSLAESLAAIDSTASEPADAAGDPFEGLEEQIKNPSSTPPKKLLTDAEIDDLVSALWSTAQ